VLFQQVQVFGCVICALELFSHWVQAFSYVFHVFEIHVDLLWLLDFGYAFCVFVVLSHQVLASTFVLEIHVGLLDLFFMFLKCFHFNFNFNDPSSCFLLVN
jgi:hypothetical protein